MPVMAEALPTDPFAMWRNWLGEWEKQVNQHGVEWLQKPEVAEALQRMTAAKVQAQAAGDEAMARFLAATNLPSKADIEALGARLAGVEAALARIEARQQGLDAAPKGPPPSRRTRKPAAG